MVQHSLRADNRRRRSCVPTLPNQDARSTVIASTAYVIASTAWQSRWRSKGVSAWVAHCRSEHCHESRRLCRNDRLKEGTRQAAPSAQMLSKVGPSCRRKPEPRKPKSAKSRSSCTSAQENHLNGTLPQLHPASSVIWYVCSIMVSSGNTAARPAASPNLHPNS